ncbi:hypothetical protein [Profundibacter sp.]
MTETLTRPATRSDILTFFDKIPGRSIRANVLEIGGKVVGVAGYHIAGGMAVVFSDGTDAIPKQRIWRESLKFMRELKIPAICIASDGSGHFLERLGWKYCGPSNDGDVYTFNPAEGGK